MKVILFFLLSSLPFASAYSQVEGTPAASPAGTSGVIGRIEESVEHGVKAAADGVERGFAVAASGIERGAKAAARGLERGVDVTASGIRRGAKATADAVDALARKVAGPPATSEPAR